MVSSYKPFPISEFKSGLFTYLEPWIRPTDAFQPLDNAYVYRGSIYKRSGTNFFGRMQYCNNTIITNGAIAANGSKSGTLAQFPIIGGAGNFVVTVLTSAGLETFTNTGSTSPEIITGKIGGVNSDTFTINYTTGAWTLQLSGGRSVGANVPVVAHYSYYPLLLTTPQEAPIMGIKQWIDETTNTKKIVILDTKRLSVYNSVTDQFDAVCTVLQTLYVAQGGAETVTINIGWLNIAPYTVSITDSVTTITDTPTSSTAGTLSSGGNFAAGGTVNYSTGDIGLNLGVGSVAGTVITITVGLQGDYFTGNASNFFNSANWLTDLFLTNGVDRVTLFDGTKLSRPPLPITEANKLSFTNNITTCLDVKVYKNRMLYLFPSTTEGGPSTKDPQSIRWSAQFVPTNTVADVAGNGGELSAPTADWLQASQFLRDYLIVFFEQSAWVFRFTGNSNDPFRWDKINNSKATNAPYGSVGYDERCTSMGNLGLIATDGVNVQRYDQEVIDLFNDIDQENFKQCFAQRFDQLNQTWMLYVSQSGAPGNNGVSDKAIVYNFIENTWATYSLPLSCLGIGFQTFDVRWQDFGTGQSLFKEFPTWSVTDVAWNSFLVQANMPFLLGGDHVGNVFTLNEGNLDFVNEDDPILGNPIEAIITSTRWNPFIGEGARVQFGYIDLYYEVDEECILIVEFFADNSSDPCLSNVMTLDTPLSAGNTYAWKRIYLNIVGEFIQMRITTVSDSGMKIVGAMLWARPAGRLVP